MLQDWETLKINWLTELKIFHMFSLAIAGLQRRLFWLSGVYFNTFILFVCIKFDI
jgi:hypothetical protein